VPGSAFASGDSKPDNRPVTKTPWQQRIRRAERLAAQHSFAAEILAFYVQVARFQEDLYQRIERSLSNSSAGVPPAVESASRRLLSLENIVAANPILLAALPQFLSLIEQKAPVRLAQVAQSLRNADSDSLTGLLSRSWTDTNSPTEPQDFLALAFLQPYAEFVRTQIPLKPESYTASRCPLCGRQPACSVLRPQGDGGRRSLLCGFCLTEWEFRRIVCPACGQEDHAKLPVYTAEAFPHIRVECCDACNTYIKSIDLTKAGLAEPIVDELAAIPLDLWAQERGYNKLRPNLLGM
jgi:FdhE protein